MKSTFPDRFSIKAFLAIVILFFITYSCKPQNEIHTQELKFHKIDTLILAQSENQSNTGIAVAIVHKKKIIYNKGQEQKQKQKV